MCAASSTPPVSRYKAAAHPARRWRNENASGFSPCRNTAALRQAATIWMLIGLPETHVAEARSVCSRNLTCESIHSLRRPIIGKRWEFVTFTGSHYGIGPLLYSRNPFSYAKYIYRYCTDLLRPCTPSTIGHRFNLTHVNWMPLLVNTTISPFRPILEIFAHHKLGKPRHRYYTPSVTDPRLAQSAIA